MSPMDMTTSFRTGWFGHISWSKKLGYSKVVKWTHCRDKFQDPVDKTLVRHGMWYCHKSGSLENLCAFVSKIETKIKLEKHSLFQRTQEKNVVWVKPSIFWIDDFVRRSFFTLVLRCGMHYKRTKDNFEEAMYEHFEISRCTKPAIDRFLNGYTFYTYEAPKVNTRGWKYLFEEEDEGAVKKMLLRG